MNTDKIIYGGTILTLEDSGPETVEAVAISGNKIMAAGSEPDIMRHKTDATEMIDLQGAIALPGLIDPHIHHALAGAFYFMTTIRADEDWNLPGLKTEQVIGHETYIKKLREADEALKDPNEWLIGYGFAKYFHGDINKDTLESISTTRPIALFQRSGHELYMNSKAMELLNFTPETTKGIEGIDVTKGHFVESGTIEHAFPAMLPIILKGNHWEKALHHSMEYLHKNGITTVGDMMAIDGFNDSQRKLFKEIIDAPDASLRTYMVAEPRPVFEKQGPEAAVEFVDSLAARDGDSLKYLKQVKIFSDGAFFAQLMRIKGKYTDGHQGEWVTPPNTLEEIMKTFWDVDYGLHIHVNGDEGLDELLNTIERLKQSKPDSHSRVVFHHLGYSHPEQIQRMQRLGIYASLLPYYIRALGDVYSKTGFTPEGAHHISASGDCVKYGVHFSLHSDFPMAPSNPLYNAWCAVNRIGAQSGETLGEDEKISVRDALKAITIEAAATLGKENEIGSIKEGKKADLTILADNPLQVDPKKLKDIKIVGKVFNGKYFDLQ